MHIIRSAVFVLVVIFLIRYLKIQSMFLSFL